ncbi:Protein of unknown function (DUF1759) [Popillia japonica]|uniref:Uncharacterized protein n=1 Tax=Popillia japonica TaxID=7064 RepID=A0AAW1JIN5_POPJA
MDAEDVNDIDIQQTLRGFNYSRGRVKATLTRISTYLDSVSDRNNICQINERLSRVRALWNEFSNLQMKITELEDDRNNDVKADLFEDNYFNTIAKAVELLLCYAVNDPSHSQEDILNNQNAVYHYHVAHLLMSQISLPSFSGEFDEWLPFCQVFDSLVTSNKSLSIIHKFHYLKSSLKGEASDCVQNLYITE